MFFLAATLVGWIGGDFVYRRIVSSNRVFCISTWHLSTQLYAVERGLVIGFSGQPPYCYRPYYPTARFRSPSSNMVSVNRFRTGQGPCHANLHKLCLTQSPSCDCGQRQTMNHIIDAWPLTEFEGGLNLLHEADDLSLCPWFWTLFRQVHVLAAVNVAISVLHCTFN